MNPNFRSSPSATQSGMSMLEVLIAILVLSLGMLGMLGLMMNSLKITTTSTYRSIATQHASGMAESLRASVRAIAHYDNPVAGITATCFGAAGCSQPTMVGAELAIWQQQLAETLPGGGAVELGTVCRSSALSGDPSNWNCNGAATDPLVIKVCWDESRVGVHTGTTPGQSYYECIYSSL